MSCAVLVEPVEVQACALVAQIIVEIDNNVVAHIHLNQWQRPFSIDTNHSPLHHAVGIGHDPCRREIVGYDFGRGRE